MTMQWLDPAMQMLIKIVTNDGHICQFCYQGAWHMQVDQRWMDGYRLIL